MYADDIAIFFENLDKLKLGIKIIKQWTEDNQMQINHKKSGIMFLRKKDYKEETELLKYPIVTNYKFLGITMDYKLCLKDHREKTQKKINYIINRIRWIPNSAATVIDKLIL